LAALCTSAAVRLRALVSMVAVAHWEAPQQAQEEHLVEEVSLAVEAVEGARQEALMVIRVARSRVCQVVSQWRTVGWMDLHCTRREAW
jgi:hypothetical protein